MIPMNTNKVKIILGDKEPVAQVMECYSQLACDFLDDFSKWIRHNREAVAYQDVATVGFWCRKSNIERMKEEFFDGNIHMGRGLLFHIAPSNVPVNFVFSWFFGLLSGNSNIVRIPSKDFSQVNILCKGIKEVLAEDKYEKIRAMTQFISYERDKEVNDYYSGICDGRIIWGGDATIERLRESKLKSKAVEVVFADRYSFAVIDSARLCEAGEDEVKQLAKGFYNDTYLMDQNACSTPHFIMWLGDYKQVAADRFWTVVKDEVARYDMQDIKVMDKYTDLCSYAMRIADLGTVKKYDNDLYVVDMKKLPENIENLRGKFGMFFECQIDSLDEIAKVITQKSQTMMVYGIEKLKLQELVVNGCMQGIDRIVPFGKALDIGVIWDGYDIVVNLSRIVTVE